MSILQSETGVRRQGVLWRLSDGKAVGTHLVQMCLVNARKQAIRIAQTFNASPVLRTVLYDAAIKVFEKGCDGHDDALILSNNVAKYILDFLFIEGVPIHDSSFRIDDYLGGFEPEDVISLLALCENELNVD